MSRGMVYLSGMMDGVSVEEGNAWRVEATNYFKLHDYETYNPYDGKVLDHNYTPNEILHRDIYFLDKSSIVLVNLTLPEFIESKKTPFFTIGEIFLAHRDRKPIISYTNCYAGRHGYEAIVTKTLPNLSECCEYINLFY